MATGRPIMEMINRMRAFFDTENMKRRVRRDSVRMTRMHLRMQTPSCPYNYTPPNYYRCTARIMIWESPRLSFYFMGFFSIFYWLLACWGICSWMAACSAAMVALTLASTVQPSDEADDMKDELDEDALDYDVAFTRGSNGRVLPQPCDLMLKDIRLERNFLTLVVIVFEKLKLILYNYVMAEQEHPIKLCCVAFILSMAALSIKINVSSSMIMYVACMLMCVIPAMILEYRVSDTEKESDTEIEEFVFAVTEDNFKVLNRAGETGDHSPTPPSLDTSATNDYFAEELPGAMPSHTRVINEDDFRMVEEALSINLSSGPLLVESRLDGSSSSSEDEEISLKPKKITEVNVEDDDDDSSEELNDFEIIEAEEIADINNRNDV